MPVFNEISGSWNLATVGSDGNLCAIITESVKTDYSLSMSPITLIAGSGESIARKMDEIDASVSISGPFLISSIIGQANNGLLNGSNVQTMPTQIPLCYDTYGFIKNIIAPTIKNDNIQNKFWGLKTMNLKFGSDGATTTATWWMDPEVNGVDPAIPWITSGIGVVTPLRAANWYDFYFMAGNIAYAIQDYSIDIEFVYDTWKPLGGAGQIAEAIGSTPNYSSYWNHAVVRILKSINIKYSLTGVISRQAARPPWGSSVVQTENVAISAQPSCMASYNSSFYDVYTYCGGVSYGIVGDFLTSLSNFQAVGVYVTEASTTIKPGLMTSTVAGEYIIPIYGSI